MGLYRNAGEFDFQSRPDHRDRDKTPGKLVTENVALANWWANRYTNIPGVEPADVQQQAKKALVNAARHYDAAHGVPFGTYAGRVIDNELKTLYRRQRNRAPLSSASLDAPLDADGEGTRLDLVAADDDTTLPMERAETRAELVRAVGALPARMRRIVEDYMNDVSSEVTARRLGISRQAVSAARKLALDNIRR
ncbi:MAG: sigma-70 family RNA polymerase sigma factor, partial [Verrucomicrobiales bacterium]|nr:sigma-70 family RNA polymerase sigma factor [Verrucomicrobiales bacterium]